MNAFKEAAKRKKATAGSAKKDQGRREVKEEAVVVSLPEAMEEETQETSAPQAEQATGEIDALLGSIAKKQKPLKKSSTLYLSEQNLDQLKKRSKKAGTSSSEYLDMLLSKLFASTNK